MASHSGSRSKETPIQECINEPEASDIDNDVEVPMFTDEDIDNIMQEADAKSELPSVAKPISLETDVKENKASECTLTEKNQLQEQQDKAIEKTSAKIEMDFKNNESAIKLPESASDSTSPNTQSEIDAIQKHVEESLLFLDHVKETKNISGNNDGEAGNSSEIKKNDNEVKRHNNEQAASITNENLPLNNEQKHINVVSEKMDDDVENKDNLQENMKDNTDLTETHALENKTNVNDQPNAMEIIEESSTLMENYIKMEDTETVNNDKDNSINTIQEGIKNNTEETDSSNKLDNSQPTGYVQESIKNASTLREAENDQDSNNINEEVVTKVTTIQEEIDKKLPLENIKETDKVANLEQNVAKENTYEDRVCENLLLNDEQKHINVVSEKMDDDVENKDNLQENIKDNTDLTETHALENKANVNDQPNAMEIIEESSTLMENYIKMEDTETVNNDKDNSINTIQEGIKNNAEETDSSNKLDNSQPTGYVQESIENASTVRKAETDQGSNNVNEEVDTKVTTIQEEIDKNLPLENIKETGKVANLEQNVAKENTYEDSMPSDKIKSNFPDSEDITDSPIVQHSQENAVIEEMDVDGDNIPLETSINKENTQSSEIHEVKEIKTIKPKQINEEIIEKSETMEVKTSIEMSKCVEDAPSKEIKVKIINVDEDTIREDPSRKDLQQVMLKETPTPIQEEIQDQPHTNFPKQSHFPPKKLCVWVRKNETKPDNKDQSPTAKSINPRPGPSQNKDGPPAKRARTEPLWMIANENDDNGESMPSNDSPTQEIAQNVPSPGTASASQDIRPALHPDMNITKEIYDEFSNWCTTHDIFKDAPPQRLPLLRRVTLEKAKRENKGVIKLNLPKTIKRVEQINHLINKHVPKIASDIVEKIACIHIEKNQLVNSAYIKWRDRDLMYVTKAFTLWTRASMTAHDKPVEISYDDRLTVEWDAEDRPIMKKHGSDEWYLVYQRMRLTNFPSQKFSPFTNHGRIDSRDKETFGLSKPFLTRIGINLPLNNAVYASNFHKETNDGTLWRVFCAAGIIHSLKIYNKGGYRVARIEYDHPVEAVQAITMFNQQEMNSRIITVKMCKFISSTPETLLPDGFTKIGPGLGPEGSPLRSIRATVEVGRLNCTLNNQIKSLNQKIDSIKTVLGTAMKAQGLKLSKKFNQTLKKIGQTDQSSGEPAMNPAQNPLNTISILSSAISNSVQNNMVRLLGVQNTPFPGAVQQNVIQNPFTNVQPNWLVNNTDTINWTTAVDPNYSSQMQPAPNTPPEVSNLKSVLSQFTNDNMQQGFIQPTFPNMQLVTNMQPILNVQPGVPNLFMQNQPIYEKAYQSGYPINPLNNPLNNQPTPLNIPSAPNNQPTFSNTQPIQTHLNTSNIKIQPPNKTIAKSEILYDSYQVKPKSRFDVPPVVKPQSLVKNISLPTIPKPDAKQIPVVVQRTAQQAAYTKNNPKPSTIKFNIPSLAAVKSNVEAKPSAPKQVPTSAQSPSTSKPQTPEEIWINKQIKALRRNSRSPEKTKNVSPKHEKIRDGTRDRERERETERVKRQNTVIFKYLPPSVSTEDLEDKMSEIGKLDDVRSLGKGTASVTFRHKDDAVTCIEMFNKAKVDGQTIEAKWAR